MVQDYQVLVLADGDTPAAAANARGHLFESFIAQILREYGFDEPHARNVNVTSDGIEIDVAIRNSFTNQFAVAEGKAYSTNVRAQALTSFYGKLQMARFDEPDCHGYLFVVPRLVADGDEKARSAERNDSKFHYLDAQRIFDRIVERGLMRRLEAVLPSETLASDAALLITEEGLYGAAKVLVPTTRRAERVIAWSRSANQNVPDSVMSLLQMSDYSASLEVHEVEANRRVTHSERDPQTPIVVSVRGSSSDFEYQFPASPTYFVGRREVVGELSGVVAGKRGTFVLNAQSGWGKSSLALKVKSMVDGDGGYALVVDSRTATSPAFVLEALRTAAQNAQESGLLELARETSWAGLKSAVASIESAGWKRPGSLMIFFDQFENVYQDEPTTRQFRDLALLAGELTKPVLLGFAWKTDLVGWTESHPYRLRDQIRDTGATISVSPMGVSDIETLLRRLEKRMSQSLGRELRQRLREYSQGLPWLFKKLANHVIREMEDHGKTQEQLVSEALNVQSLFDSDLSGLQPTEVDALRHVARFAPVPAAEVTDRYDSAVIQSLLDRRLVVAIGEKIDTYWDIFRDFLNTGEVPIEDSYTIGLGPSGVAPIVAQAFAMGGDAPIVEIAAAAGATPKSVVNVSRTLRLLGLTSSEAARIRLQETIFESDDPEIAMRRIVLGALRRHRAFSLLSRLAERDGGRVKLLTYSRALHQAFPAVDAQQRTWAMYAKAFVAWFEYAGLVVTRAGDVHIALDSSGRGELLSSRVAISRGAEHIHVAPGAPLKLFAQLLDEPAMFATLDRRDARHARTLVTLGLAFIDPHGLVHAAPAAAGSSGTRPEAIYAGLCSLPGGEAAIRALGANRDLSNLQLGEILRLACGATWKDSTAAITGKHFRGWLRRAGVTLPRARPDSEASPAESLPALFDVSHAQAPREEKQVQDATQVQDQGQ